MKKIKDMVKLSGLSRRTLQYYDDIGLTHSKRTSDNYRIYDDEDVQRLWVIILYKEMGFKQDEIKELLDADEQGISNALNKKIAAIKREVAELKRVMRFVEKVNDCGMPDISVDDFKPGNTTLADIAGILSERVQR